MLAFGSIPIVLVNFMNYSSIGIILTIIIFLNIYFYSLFILNKYNKNQQFLSNNK